MSTSRSRRAFAHAALVLVVVASGARAADTLETWDAGSGDIDFYLTMDGMGRQPETQAVAGDMLLGWGVADRLSTYLAVSLMADGHFGAGGSELGVGLFGTPVDTDHFDLDLVLDLCAGGAGLRNLCVGPSLELNLDASPDRGTWGFYARAGLEVSGREADDTTSAKAVGESSTGAGRLVDRALTVGSYLTLDARRQLLFEYDLTWRDEPEPGQPVVEHGGLAIGYNQAFSDRLEFISQARYQVPQGGEPGALGVTFGFIATLPGGGADARRDLP